ncbi:DUF2690 domain-containing protein [Streptomyces sp. NPDC004561]
MKRLKALLVAAFALAATTLTAVPAHASTSCWDHGCDGLSPSATICANDAHSPVPPISIRANDGTVVGQIELRYSNNCGAAWGRVTNYYSDAGNGWVYRYGGASHSCGITTWVPSLYGYSCYTLMLGDASSTDTAWAKGQVWYPTDGHWYTASTTGY